MDTKNLESFFLSGVGGGGAQFDHQQAVHDPVAASNPAHTWTAVVVL